MDPEKIHSMIAWPRPSSFSAVHSFLGLTGYYPRFIKNYAMIARPLTYLLRKNSCTWNPSTEATLTKLKHAMTTAPVLCLPNFTIETDASGIAIVLSFHKTATELRFSANYFCLVCDTYLPTHVRCSPSQLRSQSGVNTYWVALPPSLRIISLRQLISQMIQTPEQQKWLTKLLGFEFTIVYKSDATNKVADALSRWSPAATGSLSAISGPVVGLVDRIRAAL